MDPGTRGLVRVRVGVGVRVRARVRVGVRFRFRFRFRNRVRDRVRVGVGSKYTRPSSALSSVVIDGTYSCSSKFVRSNQFSSEVRSK